MLLISVSMLIKDTKFEHSGSKAEIKTLYYDSVPVGVSAIEKADELSMSQEMAEGFNTSL